MIRTKYTPRPWKARKQRQTVKLTNLTVIRESDDTPICYVGNHEHVDIILSAPHMLTALELAAQWWDGEYNHDQTHVKKAIFDAIAKAKGVDQ